MWWSNGLISIAVVALFVCFRSAVLVRDENATDCRCPVRCRRVLYEPELSNAQLSNLAFDRLFQHEPVRPIELAAKFGRAREVAQRVNPVLNNSDTQLVFIVHKTVEVRSHGITRHQREWSRL